MGSLAALAVLGIGAVLILRRSGNNEVSSVLGLQVARCQAKACWDGWTVQPYAAC